MERLVKIGLALLFIGCLAKMPYGYYQFVRIAGMVGFGYLAFIERDRRNNILFLVWIVSAILINPILKIYLKREIWNGIDVVWAAILVVQIFSKNDEKEKFSN